ncbi:MAG: toxin-antitoxin system TumE family protein [Candidatus Hodarchaeales archaeon]|jgi:hypothetical protein
MGYLNIWHSTRPKTSYHLICTRDKAPHHRNLATFLHHKHTPEEAITSAPKALLQLSIFH